MYDDDKYGSKHMVKPSYKRNHFHFGLAKPRFDIKEITFVLFIILIAVIVIVSIILPKSGSNKLNILSGTEYITGQQGMVILGLQNSKGPVLNADCNISISYPDKSFFVINTVFSKTSTPGIYYYSFKVPTVEGTYMDNVVCKFMSDSKPLSFSSTFHVSSPLVQIMTSYDPQVNQYSNVLSKLQSLDANLVALRDNINELGSNISKLNSRISDVNKSTMDINSMLNDSVNGVEARVTNKIQNNFDELYKKFRANYVAISRILDINAPVNK